MKSGYSRMREGVLTDPLSLLKFPKHLQKTADNMLRRDSGIEIEIMPDVKKISPNELQKLFRTLTSYLRSYDIRCVDWKGGENELAFRIRPGIQGMIGLYRVCQLLQAYFKINRNSGIHFHADYGKPQCQELISALDDIRFRKDLEPYLEKALKKYNYTGSYNHGLIDRNKGHQIAVRKSLGTLELRIIAMTFDYTKLITQLISWQNLVDGIEKKFTSFVKDRDNLIYRPMDLVDIIFGEEIMMCYIWGLPSHYLLAEMRRMFSICFHDNVTVMDRLKCYMNNSYNANDRIWLHRVIKKVEEDKDILNVNVDIVFKENRELVHIKPISTILINEEHPPHTGEITHVEIDDFFRTINTRPGSVRGYDAHRRNLLSGF